MQGERHVRLFRHGRDQALRIPRDFELKGNEAIIRKEGKGSLWTLLKRAVCYRCIPVNGSFPVCRISMVGTSIRNKIAYLTDVFLVSYGRPVSQSRENAYFHLCFGLSKRTLSGLNSSGL